MHSLGLIFSFHIQYRQPPSFYLKAPTLMYVYVLIALRALNFEARYVVTARLVAAFGWLLMVLYMVMIDPRDSMVTRDYIEYLTSNSVLIGDEVNLASRLESLNNDYQTSIIVSESTHRAAGPERFAFEAIGEVQVRGRTAPTPVYALRTR